MASRRVNEARGAYNSLKGATKRASMDTRNYFGMINDYNDIVNKMNKATQDAYDVKMREANLGMNRAENTSYNNTRNAINDLKNTMIGSASSGANQGAANATALQALLGLGQQNNELVTEGLNNIYGIAGERAAAMSQNAANAINTANEAKNNMLTAATSRYASDNERAAAALGALGEFGAAVDTNNANISMNNATNRTNLKIAKTPQRQVITNRGTVTYNNNNRQSGTVTNRNYNYNRK